MNLSQYYCEFVTSNCKKLSKLLAITVDSTLHILHAILLVNSTFDLHRQVVLEEVIFAAWLVVCYIFFCCLFKMASTQNYNFLSQYEIKAHYSFRVNFSCLIAPKILGFEHQ